jgi:hypothetical protein
VSAIPTEGSLGRQPKKLAPITDSALAHYFYKLNEVQETQLKILDEISRMKNTIAEIPLRYEMAKALPRVVGSVKG